MSYQVLARKWRPKIFADLVGQEHVVRALSNALNDNRLHHAYLLTGTRGVGKTTIARILAKSFNCERGVSADPCCICSTCQQIDSGRFVDLLEIDAASNTGIDNIREVLENAQYAPSAGRFKVYIIDEVHMLSKSAFNAMLKTLEEPPGHVKFILATTDPQKVPVTVLSRCLQFTLRNMTTAQIVGHLVHVLQEEHLIYQDNALSLLARAAAGSMRDALSLLDQAIAYSCSSADSPAQVDEASVRAMLGSVDTRFLLTLLDCLCSSDGVSMMREAKQMIANGIGFDSALNELASLLYQIALEQTVPNSTQDDEPEKEAILKLADKLSKEDVQLYYQIVLHGRKDLAIAPDESSGFLMTLLRMLAFCPQELACDNLAQTNNNTNAVDVPVLPDNKSNNEHNLNIKNTEQASPLNNCNIEVISDNPIKKIGVKPIPKLSRTDWQQLIKQLAPKLSTAQMLASHTVLHAQKDEHWTLLLSPSFKSFLTHDVVDKLSNVLSKHFDQDLHIEVVVEEHGIETPVMERERTKDEQLISASESLQRDSNVQFLQKEFGATLLPETLQPLL